LLIFFLILSIGYLIGYLLPPGFALLFSLFVSFLAIAHIYISHNYGDRIILRVLNAKPADERKHRFLIDSVEGLSIAAGIPPTQGLCYRERGA
jgi:hypothetical protein